MKNVKSLLAALILLGNITASGAALAADGIISESSQEPNVRRCGRLLRTVQ